MRTSTAWDFETDPDFQKKLDWVYRFMHEDVERELCHIPAVETHGQGWRCADTDDDGTVRATGEALPARDAATAEQVAERPERPDQPREVGRSLRRVSSSGNRSHVVIVPGTTADWHGGSYTAKLPSRSWRSWSARSCPTDAYRLADPSLAGDGRRRVRDRRGDDPTLRLTAAVPPAPR